MKKMWKKYSKNKMSVLGFVIIVLLLILVIFADLYVGYDKVLAQDVKNKLQSPSLSHICGTDNLGRDLFARLIYGARVSLGIGVAATFAGMMIGCILGAACAYIGGIFDNAVMRILDVLYCVPFVLQAMLIVAILGSSIPNLIFAVTVGNIPGYAKVTRGAVISVTERDYVKAAKVSADYDPKSDCTKLFFKMVQNMMHLAVTHRTAAEIVYERADSEMPHMGLTTWKKAPNGRVQKSDTIVAKNYLSDKEVSELNGVTNAFLEFAEQRAQRHIITTMADWKQRLEQFLATMDYQAQDSAGKVSQEEAREKAYGEYEKYKVIQDRSFISDFDRFNDGDKPLGGICNETFD